MLASEMMLQGMLKVESSKITSGKEVVHLLPSALEDFIRKIMNSEGHIDMYSLLRFRDLQIHLKVSV